MKKELHYIKIIEERTGSERDRAFTALCAMHYDYLRNFIQKRVGDTRDMEEICSDTLLKIYYWLIKGRRQYGASIRPILTKVARDLIVSHYRKKQILVFMDELKSDKSEMPTDQFDNLELFEKIIQGFTEKKRQTLLLFMQGFSHEEIAKTVGWKNASTSKNQLSRIRKEIIITLKKITNL